ncbi:MAG TPA: methyltransferase domain-containing protein [Stellaceae bacterium]|jgi:ubiquinone/menaquinone biosynthesis C-methylase UbiE|nr:methyltransferase domain-containing protein [Stellaceae bacterium]
MSAQDRVGGSSAASSPVSHDDLIQDQFSRQAALFARAPELHGDAQLKPLVEAARPFSHETMIDLACGPGTVVAAFAPLVRRAVGVDATDAMLDEARRLAREQSLDNVEWRAASVYALPFPDGSFDIVTCRFAFHHFQQPERAFAEMARVCRDGGRIVLCDGVAPVDAKKAAAFNAMERFRDPSTASFLPLAMLRDLFMRAGVSEPAIQPFHVTYAIEELVAKSFPVDDDRATLRRMIEELVATDALEVGTKPGGAHFVIPVAVLSATKPL